MCNPRRIRISATMLLNEAWQREVARMVELNERVVGEASVRQPLDATLGGPALRALEAVLAAPDSGWIEVEEGYRYDVEGGYVIYVVDDCALEIVASLEDTVQAAAEARRTLSGQVDMELEAEGEGRYYDDGWRGMTKERAEEEAAAAAQQNLDEAAQAQLEEAGRAAEADAAADLENAARQEAEARLQQAAMERRLALAEQARQHLERVGLRGRQAFHQALAQAYRNAILAYARQQGAANIQCTESIDVVEIEFSFVG